MNTQDPHEADANKDLYRLKRRVRAKYLGRCGIHGLGMRADQDAIVAYVQDQDSELASILDDLRAEVAPHDLIVIREAGPKINPS